MTTGEVNEEEASEYYMAALARHDMYKKKEENLRKSFTTWENDKEAHTTKGNVRKMQADADNAMSRIRKDIYAALYGGKFRVKKDIASWLKVWLEDNYFLVFVFTMPT